MSRRKHKRASTEEEIKLNVAAMLDMAFQLLAFFILTFKPAPVEGHIELRMPDAKPVALRAGKAIGNDTKSTDVLEGVKQLTVSLFPDEKGDVGTIVVGTTPLIDSGTQQYKLGVLQGDLANKFKDPGNPFDRLVLQVGSDMRYDTLMQVVDRCAQLKFADGSKLTKLTFIELPTGPAKKATAEKAP